MKLRLVFFIFVVLCGCHREPIVLAPNVEKLVGTWELREPISPYPVRLQFALDTDNPPRDVTPFLVSGTTAGDRYEGRASAAIDGLLVTTTLNDLVPANRADTFRQSYLANLRAVVRFSHTADNRLRLSYGSAQSGVLVYERK